MLRDRLGAGVADFAVARFAHDTLDAVVRQAAIGYWTLVLRGLERHNLAREIVALGTPASVVLSGDDQA
jgi:hypothetical protein